MSAPENIVERAHAMMLDFRHEGGMMIDPMTVWHGFGTETKAALISAAAILIAALFGFGGLILQVRSQARQSRGAIAESEKRKLKAGLYEEGMVVCRELADTAITLSNQLRMMAMQVEIAARATTANLAYDLPVARFPKLSVDYGAFANAVLRFIFLVENRRIIDPRIIIFRTAMKVVLHDTRQLMHWRFVESVMPALPTERPDGELFPYNPPSIAGAEAVRELSERFIASLEDAVCYTEDFLVELQNHLLGDLFNEVVPHRQQLDPSRKVITLDRAPELERWFETSTDWGRKMAEIEAETRDRFSTSKSVQTE